MQISPSSALKEKFLIEIGKFTDPNLLEQEGYRIKPRKGPREAQSGSDDNYERIQIAATNTGFLSTAAPIRAEKENYRFGPNAQHEWRNLQQHYLVPMLSSSPVPIVRAEAFKTTVSAEISVSRSFQNDLYVTTSLRATAPDKEAIIQYIGKTGIDHLFTIDVYLVVKEMEKLIEYLSKFVDSLPSQDRLAIFVINQGLPVSDAIWSTQPFIVLNDEGKQLIIKELASIGGNRKFPSISNYLLFLNRSLYLGMIAAMQSQQDNMLRPLCQHVFVREKNACIGYAALEDFVSLRRNLNAFNHSVNFYCRFRLEAKNLSSKNSISPMTIPALAEVFNGTVYEQFLAQTDFSSIRRQLCEKALLPIAKVTQQPQMSYSVGIVAASHFRACSLFPGQSLPIAAVGFNNKRGDLTYTTTAFYTDCFTGKEVQVKHSHKQNVTDVHPAVLRCQSVYEQLLEELGKSTPWDSFLKNIIKEIEEFLGDNTIFPIMAELVAIHQKLLRIEEQIEKGEKVTHADVLKSFTKRKVRQLQLEDPLDLDQTEQGEKAIQFVSVARERGCFLPVTRQQADNSLEVTKHQLKDVDSPLQLSLEVRKQIQQKIPIRPLVNLILSYLTAYKTIFRPAALGPHFLAVSKLRRGEILHHYLKYDQGVWKHIDPAAKQEGVRVEPGEPPPVEPQVIKVHGTVDEIFTYMAREESDEYKENE